MWCVVYIIETKEIEVFGSFESEEQCDGWVKEKQELGWKGQFLITEMIKPG